MGVNIIDLQTEICNPVLKLDFTAHGKMKSLSEFGSCDFNNLKNISTRKYDSYLMRLRMLCILHSVHTLVLFIYMYYKLLQKYFFYIENEHTMSRSKGLG
jgi:hypothetical protein